MTLRAIDQWGLVRGTKGPKYKVGPYCANPNCRREVQHVHHIIRRGYLVDDYDWVDINGWVVGNLTGLCIPCHMDLTGDVGGYKAAIRIDIDARVFWWCLVSNPNGEIHYRETGLLEPQPPTPKSLAERPLDQGEESDACPTCGHARRRRSTVGTERRRKTWTVTVPDDEREHGADILDTLVENLVPIVPSGDASTTGRYYVLVPVLAYATLDSKRFVETLKGVGG